MHATFEIDLKSYTQILKSALKFFKVTCNSEKLHYKTQSCVHLFYFWRQWRVVRLNIHGRMEKRRNIYPNDNYDLFARHVKYTVRNIYKRTGIVQQKKTYEMEIDVLRPFWII